MILYSAFMILIACPAFIISSVFSEKLRKQLVRVFIKKPLPDTSKKTIFLYCSSAGELEQALPIERHICSKNSDYKCIFLINSESGIKFIQKKSYKIDYLATPLDTILSWSRIYNQYNPVATIIIRHDFWPAFIYVAKLYAPLIFANVSTIKSNWLGSVIKYFSLSKADGVYCVNKETNAELERKGINGTITGDTKYDQAIFLADSNLLPDPSFIDPKQRYLFLGSCWHKDVESISKNLEHFTEKGFKAVFAPHNVSGDMISYIKKKLPNKDCVLLQEMLLAPRKDWEVLIIDTIGHLQGLYKYATAALIGGAFHDKVHNVLEPAAYGAFIAFGPHYHNSHEAVEMVNDGCAVVIDDDTDYTKWLEKIGNASHLNSTIKKHSGATLALYTNLMELIHE